MATASRRRQHSATIRVKAIQDGGVPLGERLIRQRPQSFRVLKLRAIQAVKVVLPYPRTLGRFGRLVVSLVDGGTQVKIE